MRSVKLSSTKFEVHPAVLHSHGNGRFRLLSGTNSCFHGGHSVDVECDVQSITDCNPSRSCSYDGTRTWGIASFSFRCPCRFRTILVRDSALPKAEIARRVGIAASVVSERIKRLVEAGVIDRYELRLSSALLGYHVLAYIFVAEAKPVTPGATAERLSKIEGVEELHKIAGEDCYLLKLRARSNEELSSILDTQISQIDGVSSVRTTIVPKAVLEDVVLTGAEEFRV